MTPSPSDINNSTVGHRGLRYNQSEMLFTLVEEHLSKDGNAHVFGELKIIILILGTALWPVDCRDLVTVRHPTMDHECAKSHSLYAVIVPKGHRHSLCDMVIDGICI